MAFHRDMRGLALHAPSNEKIENNTGSNIPKLRVVALDGHGTAFPQVVLADPNTLTNFGISTSEIIDGEIGVVTTVGFMLNVDTSPWPVNTFLYSDASGNLSVVALGNPVAVVNKQDASCGVLYVVAIGDAFGVGPNPWHLAGNLGTDPNVHYVGTQDDVGLTFGTDGVQRLRVDENGRFLFGDNVEDTPKWFIHNKQHSGFAGSGNMKETAALEVSTTDVSTIYSFVVPNYSTVMGTFRVVGVEDENTEQATFIRTGTWFREGGTAQQMGVLQSDYTNKSDLSFDMSFSRTSDTIFIEVKNANAKQTRWIATVELDIMINDAP